MKIIEKIEIKNFRSFLGTRKGEEAEVINIRDLNIFSGSNDSGKSNILRALNLFFNGEIDSVHKFNFDNDFNILKENEIQKVIEIKIYFMVNKKSFTISKYYDRNGYRNFEYRFYQDSKEIIIDERSGENQKRYGRKFIDKKEKKDNKNYDEKLFEKENGWRRYASRFLSSISFSYVPAIKEERFFSHIYGKIISKIKLNEDEEIIRLEIRKKKIKNWAKTQKNSNEKKDIKENINDKEWRNGELEKIKKEIREIKKVGDGISNLEGEINNFSKGLFESISFLNSEFKVGNNIIDFFENFDIGTGENKNISLRLRGDGVQAKFIPEMLHFLDSISKEKYFIWGFEEPENSAEYKNQEELASKLKNNYSIKKQIFLTTHSEEFLSIYDGSETDKEDRKSNLYHVKKIDNESYKDFSIIEYFDVDKNTFSSLSITSELEKDLGTSLLRAKYSKEIKKLEKKFLNDKVVDKIKRIQPKKIFIFEDKKGKKIWEHFFSEYCINDIEFISSESCTKFDWENYLIKAKELDTSYNPKVFRQNDRDGLKNEQVEFIEKELNDKYLKINYKFLHLPVNEIENFYILKDNYFSDSLINKNNDGLEIKLSKTFQGKFKGYSNEYGKSSLFSFSNSAVIQTESRQEANKNIKKYYPGKDIKKLKENLNTDEEFLKWKLEDFPKELKGYLEEIKQFFN